MRIENNSQYSKLVEILREGNNVIIVGLMGTGKSTIAANLILDVAGLNVYENWKNLFDKEFLCNNPSVFVCQCLADKEISNLSNIKIMTLQNEQCHNAVNYIVTTDHNYNIDIRKIS